MNIRPEVIPHAGAAAGLVLIPALLWILAGSPAGIVLLTAGLIWAVMTLFLLFFFRDPGRPLPAGEDLVVAPADGILAGIASLSPEDFAAVCRASGLSGKMPETITGLFPGSVFRLSTRLRLRDVHVNRAPFPGEYEYLGDFPGKRLLTGNEKSSEENRHNTVLVRNDRLAGLIFQIVGPGVRRAVYWPDPANPTRLRSGQRFGMMKFGSRLDLYLPQSAVSLKAVAGMRVIGGVTVIAHIES